MSGVDVQELDVSDALDVIHYMFEDDLRISSAEVAEAISKTRSLLYRDMYGREYKYAVKTGNSLTASGIEPPLGDDVEDDDITPFDPARGAPREVKPYFPPTNIDADAKNPFGPTLDPPLG